MRMAAALWLPLAAASNCSLADGPSLRLASRIAAATVGCDVVAYTTLVYPAGVRFPHPSTRLGPGAANGTAGVCYVLVAGAASAASLREHCDVAPWRVVALDADAAGRGDRRASRRVKLLPLEFFANARYLLFVDWKLVLKQHPLDLVRSALGAGVGFTFANFLLLSPPALRKLASAPFLDECRARLVRCDPEERGAGCKFKRHAAAGEAYMANQLVHYCLAATVGSCRRPGGCAWLFGSPDSRSRDATAARRRYVSNAGRKPPRAALLPLLGAAEDADPCDLRDALRGLVAFGHAAAPGAMAWLDGLRARGAACATP